MDVLLGDRLVAATESLASHQDRPVLESFVHSRVQAGALETEGRLLDWRAHRLSELVLLPELDRIRPCQVGIVLGYLRQFVGRAHADLADPDYARFLLDVLFLAASRGIVRRLRREKLEVWDKLWLLGLGNCLFATVEASTMCLVEEGWEMGPTSLLSFHAKDSNHVVSLDVRPQNGRTTFNTFSVGAKNLIEAIGIDCRNVATGHASHRQSVVTLYLGHLRCPSVVIITLDRHFVATFNSLHDLLVVVENRGRDG